MKYLLKLFGLLRENDVIEYINSEIKWWENERKTLTNSNDILRENSVNRMAHHIECLKVLKSDIRFLNKWP